MKPCCPVVGGDGGEGRGWREGERKRIGMEGGMGGGGGGRDDGRGDERIREARNVTCINVYR